MKKLFLAIIVLAFLFFPIRAFAQEFADMPASPSAEPSPTIDYALPYPGILPGTPVYPLKVLRDRIVEFFISDPLKRAEFYLRQGDKHLSAGELLVIKDRKNYSLAESTISKGENYMERSLSQIPTIQAIQLEEIELLNRLSTAFKKHQQVIKNLEENAPPDVKTGLEKSRQRAAEMQKRVDLLKSEYRVDN